MTQDIAFLMLSWAVGSLANILSSTNLPQR